MLRDLKFVGFTLGWVVFLVVLLVPFGGIEPLTRRMAAVTLVMAIWWMTEALPISITALVPIFAFPLLGIASSTEATQPFANNNIYLFLGGFLLAVSMQRWNLHRRIALWLMLRIGRSPKGIIAGFMTVTAILSMWVSNTATAVMMLPISMAIIGRMTDYDVEAPVVTDVQRSQKNFATALLLGIAFAASIGGIGTLVGTPPNIILVGMFKRMFPGAPEISFFTWMKIGIPLVIVFLPMTYYTLVRFIWPFRSEHLIQDSMFLKREYIRLGKLQRGELFTMIIFTLTVFLWIFRKDLELGQLVLPGWSRIFGSNAANINDSTVAMFMAWLLFLTPVDLKNRVFLLDRTWYKNIPWNILVLFGGGFALADGFHKSGLDQWVGGHISAFTHIPIIPLLLGIALLVALLSSVTSNTAIATVMLPILAATGIAAGIHPMVLMVPATIAASCAFLLPVSTPPNAVMFGSGYLTIPTMVKSGIVLLVVGTVLSVAVTYFIAVPVFEIDIYSTPVWAN